MHALIELPEGIGDDLNVPCFRLFVVPVGKGRHVGEERGLGDAARTGRGEGVFEHRVSAQSLVQEIRISPEFDAFIEEMDHDVVQFVTRDSHQQREHDRRRPPQ